MVIPLGAGRFGFDLVRGVGKEASQIVDHWKSLWPPRAGAVLPTWAKREARPPGAAAP